MMTVIMIISHVPFSEFTASSTDNFNFFPEKYWPEAPGNIASWPYKNLPDLFCGDTFTLVLWLFHAKGRNESFYC